MKGEVPRVLIAAPSDIIRELSGALGQGFEILPAIDWTQFLSRVQQKPDVVVVCYVFDEVRPYRVIQYVCSEMEEDAIPVVLVRALPVRLGNEENAVRDSYLAMGASQFLNLWSETQQHGRPAALELFRGRITQLLPRGGAEVFFRR